MVIEQLDELYRDVILDHFRSPRNVGSLSDADLVGQGTNPLCGDEMSFSIKLAGDRIEDIRFVGKGCAISQAAGSMLTDQLRGKTLVQAERLIGTLRGLMQGHAPDPAVDLGDLEALSGVRKFPVRVKCAALSWNVVEQGLADYRAKHQVSGG